MKKLVIACAIVMCAALSSCGDTERCFTVTVKVNTPLGENKTEMVFWGTRNDLDAFKADLRAAQEKLNISGAKIDISARANGKSQGDCKPSTNH